MPSDPAENQESDSGSIGVAIVEDQPAIREGLALLLDSAPGFHCVARFRSMEEALEGIADTAPDIVLVDLGLPGMSGTEGIRTLKHLRPELPSLVLSVYGDDERIFDALCAGASGYLLKKTPPDRLLAALRDAVRGGAPMSPEVARRVIEAFRDVRPRDGREGLTNDELRVLGLLVEGHNVATAAAELGVSVEAVSRRVKDIYDRLHVHSMSEAVSRTLRERVGH